MSIIPTQHRSWCAESECYTRQDGRVVHRSGGESFVDDGMVTVRLVDRGNGIEVQLQVDGRIVTEVVLILELAADLAESLVRHANCAIGPLSGAQ